MSKITFVLTSGERRTVEVSAESTVMRVAVENDIPGIAADCGGALSCATCHVYVDEAYLGRLPGPEPMELEMLEFTAAERKLNSRLSCQLKVNGAFEELVVHLPETQHGCV